MTRQHPERSDIPPASPAVLPAASPAVLPAPSTCGPTSRALRVLEAIPGGAARPDYAPFPEAAYGKAQSIAALYVHVPFFASKCHYCDFYSVAGHLDQADAYLEALGREIRIYGEQVGRSAPETIFIGGGTPTLLDPVRLSRLLEMIRNAIDSRRLSEFTVEANPNTFCPDRARVLAEHGVNRISFGAQSFVASELRTLQRDHDPANVPAAADMARAAGITNFNVDLIFGIPGQTLATWDHSLRQALALGSQHLSCYSLIYEPNTAMTARMHRGQITPMDEDTELALFHHVYSLLRGEGFERYEVSNYARPGFACRHNLHYWKGAAYLAWGPSAAAHVAGHRWKNVQSLAHYLEALLPEDGHPPVLPLTQHEHLPPLQRAGELAVVRLRLVEGLDYAAFAAQTGIDAREQLARVRRKYEGLGLLEDSPTRLALSEKAVAVSDAILADVLAAFG